MGLAKRQQAMINPRNISIESIANIMELNSTGLNFKKIADQLGIDYYRLMRWKSNAEREGFAAWGLDVNERVSTGPWTVSAPKGHCKKFILARGVRIAAVDSNRGTSPQTNNAELMAEAPAMFVALKEARRWIALKRKAGGAQILLDKIDSILDRSLTGQ
jgi:hypothetical protein